MPAGVNSTDGSHRGTRTSLGLRVWPFDSKKARYFSRISSVFMSKRRRRIAVGRRSLASIAEALKSHHSGYLNREPYASDRVHGDSAVTVRLAFSRSTAVSFSITSPSSEVAAS